MKKRKLLLAASLFLCLATASCSDAEANPTPSENTPSQNVPTSTPSTNPSTNPSTTPDTTPSTSTPSESDSIKDQFDCISIERALEIATQNGSETGETRYYIYGTIKKVNKPEFGNMTITDGKDEILAYGTYSADGSKKYKELSDKPVAGDEVVLYSTLKTHTDKNGNEIKEIFSGHIVAFKHAGSDTPSIQPTDTTKPTETSKPTGPIVKPTENPNLPQDVNAYYANAHGTKGELKDSLHDIISVRENTSYGDLWTTYRKVDVRPDGKIMDIYSNITNFRPGTDQAGSYVKEGDVYNREHTIPKSWWGGSKSNQGADPFIVFPSDGYVNNQRSAWCFGEVDTPSYQSAGGYSKLGSSKFGGPSIVFEPADEWKGDMARAYFYATTCYYTDNWRSGEGSKIFTSDGNFGFTDYASKLLLKWHFQDPVSDWEIQRNNGIYKINNNRNPYIDHPEFVEQIWGNVTF